MRINIKNIFAGAFLLLLCDINAQPPEGKAVPGTIYGAVTDAENAVGVSELISLVKGPDTIAVKVKGKVNEVCTKKGCWLTMRMNDSTDAFVKMENYGFFVPLDLAGKEVVLNGRSFLKTTGVAELKHYAQDGGKSKKEVEAITQPKKEYRIIAKGILVIN